MTCLDAIIVMLASPTMPCIHLVSNIFHVTLCMMTDSVSQAFINKGSYNYKFDCGFNNILMMFTTITTNKFSKTIKLILVHYYCVSILA